MSNKRYFWLKLKEDFFGQKEIKMLRKIAGGDTYTIIYLKLLLLSLKNEGMIYFDGIADNFIEEIALDIDEDVENVKVTFTFLKNKGLIEFSDNVEDEVYLNNIASMIGSESESARRVRKHRNRKALQSNGEVTAKKHLSNTEKEKIREDKDSEKETDTDKEKDTTNSSSNSDINVHTFYQQNFGVETPFIIEDLQMWVEDLNAEMVQLALQKAIEKGAAYAYAKGIMKNWKQKNISSVEEANSEAVQRQKQSQYNKGGRSHPRAENLPDWAKDNYEAPEDTWTEEEKAEAQKRHVETLKKIRERREVQ